MDFSYSGTKKVLVTRIFCLFHGIVRNTFAYVTETQRIFRGSHKSGLLQQVVFRCRFYWVDLRRGVVSEQWSPKPTDCLIQVVSITGLTVDVVTVFNISRVIKMCMIDAV